MCCSLHFWRVAYLVVDTRREIIPHVSGDSTCLLYPHYFENFELCKCSFYKVQAYHVGLGAVLGGCRQTGPPKENEHIMIKPSYWWQHVLPRDDVGSEVVT